MSLFKLVDGNWVLINASVTNADGRCADLLQQEAFRSGRYKLNFGVEKYFKNTETIYPFVEVMDNGHDSICIFVVDQKQIDIFFFDLTGNIRLLG